jgi:hypothetical protein
VENNMSGFDLAFERVVGHEGLFTDDPNDRGNWTSGVWALPFDLDNECLLVQRLLGCH